MRNDAYVKATEKYIAELKMTETYQKYCIAKECAKKDEELWRQLCDYRKKSYEFQTMTSPEEMFDRVDAFEREYSEWKNNPKVSEFLDAELALCRMLQEIKLSIVEAMQFE